MTILIKIHEFTITTCDPVAHLPENYKIKKWLKVCLYIARYFKEFNIVHFQYYYRVHFRSNLPSHKSGLSLPLTLPQYKIKKENMLMTSERAHCIVGTQSVCLKTVVI